MTHVSLRQRSPSIFRAGVPPSIRTRRLRNPSQLLNVELKTYRPWQVRHQASHRRYMFSDVLVGAKSFGIFHLNPNPSASANTRSMDTCRFANANRKDELEGGASHDPATPAPVAFLLSVTPAPIPMALVPTSFSSRPSGVDDLSLSCSVVVVWLMPRSPCVRRRRRRSATVRRSGLTASSASDLSRGGCAGKGGGNGGRVTEGRRTV